MYLYFLTLLLVSISNCFDVVVARSKQDMEEAPLCSKDSHSPIQYDHCPNNGLSTPVPNNATYPFMDLDFIKIKYKQMSGKMVK